MFVRRLDIVIQIDIYSLNLSKIEITQNIRDIL